MEKEQQKYSYDSSSERDLIKLWEDIKGNDHKDIARNLMKEIEKNTDHPNKEEEPELYSKQMWDSEKNEWVKFDIWGANFIINCLKEKLLMRIYRPLNNHPEHGNTNYGWQSLDSSYLTSKLTDKDKGDDVLKFMKLFSGIAPSYGENTFEEWKRNEDYQRKEYEGEGRLDEYLGRRI